MHPEPQEMNVQRILGLLKFQKAGDPISPEDLDKAIDFLENDFIKGLLLVTGMFKRELSEDMKTLFTKYGIG